MSSSPLCGLARAEKSVQLVVQFGRTKPGREAAGTIQEKFPMPAPPERDEPWIDSNSDNHAGADSINPRTHPSASGQRSRRRPPAKARTPSQSVTSASLTTV